MEKLVCDRCGAEYEDEESVRSAKAAKDGWERRVRADGDEPRGICPCPNISCTGELVLKEVKSD